MTTSPTASYGYDYNGNTLTKVTGSNTTNYAWDFENRLSSVTLPGSGGTVSFKYDPFGRRIYKSSSEGTSIYAYDQGNAIEEVNGSGALVARYADTLHVDDPLAMLRSSATSYYETDGLGTVTSLSNSAGSLAQTYGYDSFGKQLSSTGSLANPFQYTAREFDSETSLNYYRARYFDSSAGRFISEDPLHFGQGVNFYAYVGNGATNLVDPTGLAKCCPTKEENDIQRLADETRARLDQLHNFGTAVLPTDPRGGFGAASGCSSGSFAILNGQQIAVPDQYNMFVKVDPVKHPSNTTAP